MLKAAKKSQYTSQKKSISPEKKALIELSQRAKEIKKQAIAKAEGELEMFRALALTINDVVLSIYESETGSKEWKTFKQWKEEGFQVKKGEKAFYVWGAPRTSKNKTEGSQENGTTLSELEQKFQYWPTCCLFHEKQVEKMQPNPDKSESESKQNNPEKIEVKEKTILTVVNAKEETETAQKIVNNPFVCESFDEKQNAKIERLEERAVKARKTGENNLKVAREMGSVIPFGQPILIGHHSEKRDRNYRSKMVNKYDKGFEALKKSEAIEKKVSSIGCGGIASDDPTALNQLNEKLKGCELKQLKMKAVNKAAKNGDKEALMKLGLSEKTIESVNDFIKNGEPVYASYSLTNNGAEIRRLKKRIEDLNNLYAMEPLEHVCDDFEVSVDSGRIHFTFTSGKPSECVRDILKKQGFKWSRYSETWVRKVNQTAIHVAKIIISELAEIENIY
jgi:hypothetical protein